MYIHEYIYVYTYTCTYRNRPRMDKSYSKHHELSFYGLNSILVVLIAS